MISKYTNNFPVKQNECLYCTKRKENTIINSLFEVEYFLNNLKQVIKGVKIYNLLRW